MLIEIVAKAKVNTIRDLVNTAQSIDRSLEKEEVYQAVVGLQKENKVDVVLTHKFRSFIDYVKELSFSIGLWFVLLVTAITILTVFVLPQIQPLTTIRMVAGIGFVIFLPGYALMELLFTNKDMGSMERIAVGVGLSLAVAPIVGFMLSYSPWGITLIPLVVSLGIVSVSLMFAGTYKMFLLLKRGKVLSKMETVAPK